MTVGATHLSLVQDPQQEVMDLIDPSLEIFTHGICPRCGERIGLMHRRYKGISGLQLGIRLHYVEHRGRTVKCRGTLLAPIYVFGGLQEVR